MTREQLLLTAIRAALAGGRAIMEVYNAEESIEVSRKGDNSPLTRADTAAHQVIAVMLKDTEVPVLSEEGREIPYDERSKWNTLWIVDPLDGTKEFIRRNGEFTVNIALVENHKPTLGVVYVPVLKTLYFGDAGRGAFAVQDVESGDAEFSLESLIETGIPLPVAEQRPFTVVGSRSHMNEDTTNYIAELEARHGVVEMISRGSSLKICMVAEGKADEYPRFAPTMEWDTAAGHAVAAAAGKEVIIPGEGTPLVYNKENLLNPYFLVR